MESRGRADRRVDYNVQRRRLFRVPVSIELKLCLDASPVSHDGEPARLTTLDISGGGLSFLWAYPLKIAHTFEGTACLKTQNGQRLVPFTGAVVGCVKQPDQSYRISVQFVQITEAERSEVIRYCMLKQIEMRNKLRNYLI
ncbi:flagellar brake protein [Paenibacillus ginsengihumi]|uniref:flagellar brake protein n=1 Tax=Paenibacillus ginsengihumi TaxID=431596 RepID=UPI000A043A64|nr:PilZ domain-containing protein [Paenibacillus ginsengihumi]